MHIFKEDVHISIVENPRPSYFCATIKTLKQHDEEKINTIILFCRIRFWSCKSTRLAGQKRNVEDCYKSQ